MKKIVLVLVILLFSGAASGWAGSVPVMDKDELKSMLDSPDLVILDVRTGRDWSSSEFKITGATFLDSDEVAEATMKYGKDKTIVLYCA